MRSPPELPPEETIESSWASFWLGFVAYLIAFFGCIAFNGYGPEEKHSWWWLFIILGLPTIALVIAIIPRTGWFGRGMFLAWPIGWVIFILHGFYVLRHTAM
jgi:hypothetical protein